MAVTRIWPVRKNLGAVIDYAQNPDKTTKSLSKYSSADYQSLKDVIDYARNGEKTEEELFCAGINCNPGAARDQFITIKEEFGKTEGIQAYHGYISFKEQNITPELAQKIGMEFAQRVWGEDFQVLVTTHLNTEHLHCHFVVNSVSFKDGRVLHDDQKVWFQIRKIADEICREYGLDVIENPERNPDSRYLTKKEKAGMPSRYNVARAAIDEAISMSTNQADFEYELRKMGYRFDSNPRHKYWTITIKDDAKPIRLYRLGPEYTKDRLIERLIENRDNIDFQPFQPRTYHPRQYVLLTRLDKIRHKKGLYGLYLHYCYELGVLPKYTQQSATRVHYLLRPDLMKLDELTAQTTLLGKHHIGTAEQLFLYQQSVEDRIKELSTERAKLRNEIRKAGASEKSISEDKDQISEISGQLKELRKEIKLCDGIAERSGVIRDNLTKAIADAEKENRKEKQKYGYKR